MIIGTKKLLELVKDKEINLVEGLCERELTNPEGEGFDLRADKIYMLVLGKSFLGIENRNTPKLKLIMKYDENKSNIFTLKPGDYRLVKTIEKINLPENISAIFTPRTTLQRSGIQLLTSNASPGYSGELTFGIKNIGENKFYLQLGARICTAIFSETSENISPYRGQWQGGRVSTNGENEKQV
jgi:deoxycytidine triphosphate deaminase